MILYRVENEQGLGPYVVGAMPRNETVFSFDDTPAPIEDGIDALDLDEEIHFFAFARREDAYRWFARHWEALKRTGFRLVLYYCPEEHVLRGGKQVAFDMTKAQKIRSPHAF